MSLNARPQEKGEMNYIFRGWNQWDWGIENGIATGENMNTNKYEEKCDDHTVVQTKYDRNSRDFISQKQVLGNGWWNRHIWDRILHKIEFDRHQGEKITPSIKKKKKFEGLIPDWGQWRRNVTDL